MLTLFTTAKPFEGHNGIIQRNALKSWTLLHPDVEVILFGDDEGAAEVASDLGIKHVPYVEKHESGMKYLRSFFDPAQQLARHPIVCYINCDIVLTSDFRAAIERLENLHPKFVMVGRRWDLDVQLPLRFENPDWEADLRRLTLSKGNQRAPNWIDYFVFPRGFYFSQLPGFVIGRVCWDNWLVWSAPYRCIRGRRRRPSKPRLWLPSGWRSGHLERRTSSTESHPRRWQVPSLHD